MSELKKIDGINVLFMWRAGSLADAGVETARGRPRCPAHACFRVVGEFDGADHHMAVNSGWRHRLSIRPGDWTVVRAFRGDPERIYQDRRSVGYLRHSPADRELQNPVRLRKRVPHGPERQFVQPEGHANIPAVAGGQHH